MKKNNQSILHAGRFSTWLRNTRISLVEGRSVAVPCGECDVCCKSFQFIHINPKEIRTINRIPKKLLFPAPFLPEGNMILGYDENGRCPMFLHDKCSIYRDRPATCRSFDCRVLAASGVEADEKNYKGIMQQVRRWQFSFSADRDRELYSAVRAASEFLTMHRKLFPDNWVPRNSIQLAVLSIIVCDVFLKVNGRAGRNSDIVKRILTAYKKFESRKRSTSSVIIMEC